MFGSSYKDFDNCVEHSVPFTFCTRGMVNRFDPRQTLDIMQKEFVVPNRAALAARATQKLTEMFDSFIDSRRNVVAKGFACIKNMTLNVIKLDLYKMTRYSHGSPFVARLRVNASGEKLSSALWTVTMQAPDVLRLADIIPNYKYAPHSKCVTHDKLLPKFCFCTENYFGNSSSPLTLT